MAKPRHGRHRSRRRKIVSSLRVCFTSFPYRIARSLRGIDSWDRLRGFGSSDRFARPPQRRACRHEIAVERGQPIGLLDSRRCGRGGQPEPADLVRERQKFRHNIVGRRRSWVCRNEPPIECRQPRRHRRRAGHDPPSAADRCEPRSASACENPGSSENRARRRKAFNARRRRQLCVRLSGRLPTRQFRSVLPSRRTRRTPIGDRTG